MTFRQWLQLKFQHIRFKFQLMSLKFQLMLLIKELAEKTGVKIEETEARDLLAFGLWMGFTSGLITPRSYVSLAPLSLKLHLMQRMRAIDLNRNSKMSPEAQALRSAREQLIEETVEKSGGRVLPGPGHFNRRRTGLRVWFQRIVIFLQWLLFRSLERIITFLQGFFVWNEQWSEQSKKEGMLIFCKDFDKCVENVRNKKTINAPVVHATIEPMETEIHGGSEFWKFPAIGEQSIKERQAEGFTLIGALLISDQVWLRVINDDFEFDVARQICEQSIFGYLNVKRKVNRR